LYSTISNALLKQQRYLRTFDQNSDVRISDFSYFDVRHSQQAMTRKTGWIRTISS